ncbi:unnamed protein product, partial [Prorocentrum cordatum]
MRGGLGQAADAQGDVGVRVVPPLMAPRRPGRRDDTSPAAMARMLAAPSRPGRAVTLLVVAACARTCALASREPHSALPDDALPDDAQLLQAPELLKMALMQTSFEVTFGRDRMLQQQRAERPGRARPRLLPAAPARRGAARTPRRGPRRRSGTRGRACRTSLARRAGTCRTRPCWTGGGGRRRGSAACGGGAARAPLARGSLRRGAPPARGAAAAPRWPPATGPPAAAPRSAVARGLAGAGASKRFGAQPSSRSSACWRPPSAVGCLAKRGGQGAELK